MSESNQPALATKPTADASGQSRPATEPVVSFIGQYNNGEDALTCKPYDAVGGTGIYGAVVVVVVEVDVDVEVAATVVDVVDGIVFAMDVLVVVEAVVVVAAVVVVVTSEVVVVAV
jgi:hypothetical protein